MRFDIRVYTVNLVPNGTSRCLLAPKGVYWRHKSAITPLGACAPFGVFTPQGANRHHEIRKRRMEKTTHAQFYKLFLYIHERFVQRQFGVSLMIPYVK